ncbi:RDD family protein [Bacillaceae bacterium Marseille-Q3522]|nr:RDD family protein [Bacillaceae bacterium Marseille-Q3522]
MITEKYAGFWIRVAAMLVELFMLVILYLIPSGLLTLTGDPLLNTAVRSVVLMVLSTGYAFYAIMMPASKYQATLGKYIFGLKIVDESGIKLTPQQSAIRYFSQILSGITLFIGYIMIAFTKEKRGLHDLLAKTYVVKKAADTEAAGKSQSAV